MELPSVRRVCAVAFLALLVAFASPLPSLNAQVTHGSISGSVTSEDGEPLPGMTVTIHYNGMVAVSVTDHEGRFALRNVPAGTHTVEVMNEGFATYSTEVTVNLGAATSLDIILPVAVPITGTISGTVKNAAGAPVHNAEVTLRAGAEKETKTDAEGKYKQTDLLPGTWTLKVTAKGYRSAERTVELEKRERLEVNFTLDPASKR